MITKEIPKFVIFFKLTNMKLYNELDLEKLNLFVVCQIFCLYCQSAKGDEEGIGGDVFVIILQ